MHHATSCIISGDLDSEGLIVALRFLLMKFSSPIRAPLNIHREQRVQC